jgi:hypothetical protein
VPTVWVFAFKKLVILTPVVNFTSFCKQLFCQFPFAKKYPETQIVRKEKLRKTLSYKKAARKMLLKLTPRLKIGISVAQVTM